MSEKKTTPPVIEKYLDCSTGHVTYEDVVRLDRMALGTSVPESVDAFLSAIEESGICAVYKYTEGFWVYTGGEEYNMNKIREQFSEAFVKVLQFAMDSDCTFLRLDCDGPTYEQFELFEW